MNGIVTQGKLYEEKVINSAKLVIPRDLYQRGLDNKHVREIAASFDECIANEPKVSARDGSFFVFDGQHTIAARKMLNGGQDLPILCKVYTGLSEQDRKGSIETTQEIEIYFNFVGKYMPPHFGEVNLTLEELEALRKKEERKDRLHQNYLKRKASGWQREYYDRTKSEKRRKIEDAKAAIRAEDMAKGVFIPVSQLPKQEPQKAPGQTRTAV